MNRRSFLRAFTATAAGVVVSEQLAELLVPRRTIFLPPRGGWIPASPKHALALDLPIQYMRKLQGEVVPYEAISPAAKYLAHTAQHYGVYVMDTHGAQPMAAVGQIIREVPSDVLRALDRIAGQRR